MATAKGIIEQNGYYYARKVVPVRLRSIIGKRELKAALGGDRKIAERNLHPAMSEFNKRIEQAEKILSDHSIDGHDAAQFHYARELVSGAFNLDHILHV